MINTISRDAARKAAQDAFESLQAQGNRFYYYQQYYYFRINGGKGWLVDFEDHNDVVFELIDEKVLAKPWWKCRRIVRDELLRLAMPIAKVIDTAGVSWDDFAAPGITERMQAEEYVNACDERNIQPMKGITDED